MSKFCSQCGSMMEDAQVFCGVCGKSSAAPQQPTPQYGAPQYGAPQQPAPQQPTPQYGAPQQPTPQYGAPQYNAPKKPATPGIFSNMDWMGMLTGKAPMFQNCLAALAVQLLSFICFFLPMSTGFKISWYGIPRVSHIGIFRSSHGAGYLVPVLAILVLLGSVAFLLYPLLVKKEIKPLNVLVFFAGQTVYLLTVVIAIIVRVISNNIGIGSSSISFGFILFILFTLAAMFVSGRILFFNKDEVMAIFKSKPANNNVVNNAYPNNQYAGQPMNNVPNNYPQQNIPTAPQDNTGFPQQ